MKGDDCWSQSDMDKYHKENGNSQQAMLAAYRGSQYENSRSLGYSCPWNDSEFYLETLHEDTQAMSLRQARVDHSCRIAALSILVFSQGGAQTCKSINVSSFPGKDAHALGGPNYELSGMYSPKRGAFFLSKDLEPDLIRLAKSLYSRSPPETYLASLRLHRATNRNAPDDTLVDLVIALEAMLSAGPTEIKYRVTQRLNRLLQCEKDRRLEISEIISNAYAMRSNFVHGTKYQISYLEELCMKSDKKAKSVRTEKVHELIYQLLDIIFSALKIRMLDYADMQKSDLLGHLDYLAT